MADITMSKDETLELDVIIEESSRIGDNINIDRSDYDLNGLQTHTGVFNPQGTGQYTITVNGRELTVEVIGTNAVPDSTINHWPFLDRSNSTVVDKVGSSDGTANGSTNVSGAWYDGYAEDGDGTDDYINLGKTAIGPERDTGFTILFTVQTTQDTVSYISGKGSSVSGWLMMLSDDLGSAGSVDLFLADSDGDREEGHTSGGLINDGSKHRVAWRVPSADATTWEVYIDGSSVGFTVDRNEGASPSGTFDYDLYALARNNNGSADRHLDGTMDNILFCGTGLTSQEITNDYNNQPWS